MAITQITDHAARAAAALIEQYKDKPRVVGLLTAFVNQIQKAEDGLFPLLSLPKPGPVNLAPNPSFESDSDGDGLADAWNKYNNTEGLEPSTMSRVAGSHGTFGQQISWSVPNTSTKGILTAGGGPFGVAGGWRPNKTYEISLKVRATGSNIGQTMTSGWNTGPASTVFLLNPPLTADAQRYAWRITWGASVELGGGLFLSISSVGTSGTLVFDEILVTEGADLLDYVLTGANLDLLGSIVGEPRIGRNDLSYRTAVQAKILLNLSSGTIEELYAIFALLISVNGLAVTMQLAEHFPKAFTMRLQGAAVPDAIAADLAKVLKSGKDAGARAFLDYSPVAPLAGYDGTTGFDGTSSYGGSL